MEWFPLGGMSEQRVGEQRVGEQRAELSAEQRAEIAQLIAEIDRVQEETASSLEHGCMTMWINSRTPDSHAAERDRSN